MPDDPSSDDFDFLNSALADRRATGAERRRIVAQQLSPTHVAIDGKTLVNFCSNDYLGLSKHPKIASAMARATAEHGSGSGASPLVTGHTPAHASAERAIARWKGTQSALLLPSGYQANHAAVQTLFGAAEQAKRAVRFLLDKLVHASLIDAVRGTGGEFRVFPHNDLTKLKRLLEGAEKDQTQVVVTESIFSMDGDAAPLAQLAELKRARSFVLLLDDAHATGVYGTDGAGYANELGLSSLADVSIVTLSKALGICGGAICASNAFTDAVANFGRAYIYSTAISPALAGGTEAAIAVLHDEPQRQRRVRELAKRVRKALTSSGVPLAPGDSPIIPIIVGEERAAIEAAARLAAQGMFVLPIRPPTVAPGTSRLRVTLSCEHSDAEVEQLTQSLLRLLRETR